MATIELDDRSVVVLTGWQHRARQLNVPLDAFLRSLVVSNSPIYIEPPYASIEEMNRDLSDLDRELGDTPPLPDDFSRADIYHDHD